MSAFPVMITGLDDTSSIQVMKLDMTGMKKSVPHKQFHAIKNC